MPKIFISHSSKDNAKALAVVQWLEQNGWTDTFLDFRDLAAGELWQDALKNAADRCEAILLLVSLAWQESKWCQDEFQHAQRLCKTICLLIIEPIAIKSLSLEVTAKWQLCDLVTGDDQQCFEVAHQKVPNTVVSLSGAGLRSLKQGLLKAGLDPSVFPYDPTRGPYRGLRALEAEDAGVFFGREAPLIRGLDMLRRMTDECEHLFVILGASGAGKSSFLRAGLWPRLKRDERHFLPLPVIRPERAAISGQTGLMKSLEKTFREFKIEKARATLCATLAKPEGLVELVVELQATAQKMLGPGAVEPTIVIAIDQAEELFRSGNSDEATQILDQLGVLIGQTGSAHPEMPVPRVIVIMAIRSDSYEELQTAAALKGLRQTPFSLPPLALAEYKMVIEGPAARATAAGQTLTVEPALTEQLLRDAEGADALPLLAFVLEKLLVRHGSDGDLLLKEYHALGGLQGSIEAAVTQAFNDPEKNPTIPADETVQRMLLQQAFLSLVTLDQDSEKPKRLVATWATLPTEIQPLLERLVEARLLTKDRRKVADGEEEVVVEVTHEALLRQWGILTTWLKLDGANVKLVDSVRRATAEWRKAQHVEKSEIETWLIHDGEALADAERLLSCRDYDSRFGADERDYLKACREKVQAARAERVAQLTRIARAQEWTKVLLGAIAIVLVVAGVLIIKQARELQRQTSRVYASVAKSMGAEGRYDQALRMGVLALQNTDLLERVEQEAVEAELSRLSYMSAQISKIHGPGEVVTGMFSADRKQVVTTSEDNIARVWDVKTGTELVALPHDDKVRAATFSPAGRRLVTASADKTARVWDVETGKKIATLPHGEEVEMATLSFDGKQVVTASGDKTARVWDIETGMELVVLPHEDKVRAATFSSDGKQVLTVSWDNTVRVWIVETQKVQAILRHGVPVAAAAFSPDGRQVVTVSWVENSAQVWDVKREKVVANLQHDDTVEAATFSPDGSKVVTASRDKTVRIWEVATGRLLATLRHDDIIVTTPFSQDGQQIVTVSGPMVRVWEVATGKELAILRHGAKVVTATFSLDGQQVMTVSEDKTVRMWEMVRGRVLATLKDDGRVETAVFNPDGKQVLTVSEDQTVRVWDIEAMKELVTLSHDRKVEAATFISDGQQMLTVSGAVIRVWDVVTGKLVKTMQSTADTEVAGVSPDGQWMVTVSNSVARVRDISTGAVLANLHHNDKVVSANFSFDDHQVVTASKDGMVRVWDRKSGRELVRLRHDHKVVAAMLNRDGRQVVTVSADKTARVWDRESGTELVRLHHDNKVVAAVFNASGTEILTVSEHKVIQGWDAPWVMRYHAQELVGKVCREKLSGARLVTESDVEVSPVLSGRVGEDVCVPKSWMPRILLW